MGGRLATALALAPLGAVLGLGFGGALVLAVAQALGYAPWFGVDTFPDTRFFAALWGSRAFWTSLALTLWYASFATALALLLGVPLALILVRRFPGRRLFGQVYRLPLMIPYAVGIALAVAVMGNGGVLSRFTAAAGVIDAPGDFPRLLHTHAGWGIVAVYVWKQMPFVALALHAVLIGVGPDTREAAMCLGARGRTILWRVTLPQMLPGLASTALICFAFNVGAFEAPFILGGGAPDTLPVLAWRAFNDADYTRQLEGMAIVVSLALVAGAILFAHLAFYRWAERRMGRG